jgi:hypothetical protein
MIRNIKPLALAFVATLALSAMTASVASAQFTSDKEHTILHGSQFGTHEFTVGAGFGGISCSTATFSGTAVSKSESSQVVQPTYSGCKDSFGRTVDIDNGETFTDEIGPITIHTVSNRFTYTFTSGAGKGTVHVSGKMTLTVTNFSGTVICTVVIKTPQTNNGIEYANVSGDVLVDIDSTNVRSTTSGGFFNCGVGNGEHFGGTYTGGTLMSGEATDGSAASISVD